MLVAFFLSPIIRSVNLVDNAGQLARMSPVEEDIHMLRPHPALGMRGM